VISVAASGWIYQFATPSWWFELNVPEGQDALSQYYMADFSSIAFQGQDLDVTAPGSFVVGPYQLQMGQLSYYFLSGTSMASPHVAGIVALMAEKYPDLTQSQAEEILTEAAKPFNELYYGPENFGSGFVTADAALGLTP
jgi:subtilisin family serine protease